VSVRYLVDRRCGRHPDRVASHIAGSVNTLGMFLCQSCAGAHDHAIRAARANRLARRPGWVIRALGFAHKLSTKIGAARAIPNGPSSSEWGKS
jgi:hypothetical protein